MKQKEFSELLNFIVNLLKQTEELKQAKSLTETIVEREQLTIRFMDKLMQLYLLIKTNPSYQESVEYSDFIKNSEYILRSLLDEIDSYIDNIRSELKSSFYDYYPDKWEKSTCWRRSAVEAVKEMYLGTFLEQFYEGSNPDELDLNTEDLDDSLEIQGRRKGGLKEDQIPKGIPTSHWWWWSPEEPPNSR